MSDGVLRGDLERRLVRLVGQSPEMVETLEACRRYGLPNHYLAGGAVTQMVWNGLLGRPLLDQVKDFDVVYFADEPLEAQARHEEALQAVLGHGVAVDVKNQARVHEWYPRKFGREIEPYGCAEDGIASWLPAFAVGVRLEDGGLEGKWCVVAPFGLSDLWSMRVRPNKTVMGRGDYVRMTASFKRRWPQIVVGPW